MALYGEYHATNSLVGFIDDFRAWDSQNNVLVQKMHNRPFYERYAVFYRWRRMLAEAKLQHHDKIIDLGGGLGYISKVCADGGHKVVHVDADEKLLNFAMSYADGSGIEFLNKDLEALDLPSNSFDVAFCGEVIEHINNDRGFLQNILRILKPGGRLVLTTPNENAFAYVVLKKFPVDLRRWLFKKFSKDIKLHAGVLDMQKEMQNLPKVHKRVGYGKEELIEKMEATGFEITKFANFGWLMPNKVVAKLPDSLSLFIFNMGAVFPRYSSKHLIVGIKSIDKQAEKGCGHVPLI